MSVSSFAVEVSKVRDGVPESLADSVAVEEPLEIRLGYTTPDGRATRSISITMRTPGNDRELAAGFLYSEAIIHQTADIASIETCGPPAPDSGNHNVVRVDLASDVAVDLGRLQRHFYTTSSCGVCGKTSLDALRINGAEPLDSAGVSFCRSVLTGLPDALRATQVTFDSTGGLHAAAAFSPKGDLLVTMEDVGRHNAVDKVIGSLLLNNELPANELGLIVSGRASFELMQKTLVAGMPLLAAVSAPSSLAVQLAKEFNVSLVGFLRGDTFNIYSGEQRITE
ncbi:MAG: formate dehydrogenase accessory sulfurtransferase FdhD [Woeseiaceae bacterium]